MAWAVLGVSSLSVTLCTPISAIPNFARDLNVVPPHLTQLLNFKQRAKCLNCGISFPFIQHSHEISSSCNTQPCQEVKINVWLFELFLIREVTCVCLIAHVNRYAWGM